MWTRKIKEVSVAAVEGMWARGLAGHSACGFGEDSGLGLGQDGSHRRLLSRGGRGLDSRIHKDSLAAFRKEMEEWCLRGHWLRSHCKVKAVEDNGQPGVGQRAQAMDRLFPAWAFWL